MNWPGRVVLLIAIAFRCFCSGGNLAQRCASFWRRSRTPTSSCGRSARASAKCCGKWRAGTGDCARGRCPGLAHAFVFWGFCVFALVTLNHFAAGIRDRISVAMAASRGFIFWLAGVFAVAVAIVDCGPGVSQVCDPAEMAGAAVSGIGADRVFDFRFDGHLPGRAFWCRKATWRDGRCGGRTRWCCWFFLPLIPEHQAYASGAESADGVSGARRIQQAFRRWWATRISGSTRARI